MEEEVLLSACAFAHRQAVDLPTPPLAFAVLGQRFLRAGAVGIVHARKRRGVPIDHCDYWT